MQRTSLFRLAGAPALLALALAAGAQAQTATLLTDVVPPANGSGSGSSDPSPLNVLGNRLVFTATEPNTGREIWGTDGTPFGTGLLYDVCPGPCSAAFQPAARLGDVQLLFAIVPPDGGHIGEVSLWRSDGTRGGTFRVGAEDLRVAARYDFDSNRLVPFGVTLGNAFYFTGCREGSCRMWKTDGTPAGTAGVLEPWSGTPAVAGGRLYYFRDGSTTLWKSDGTPAGTVAVKALDSSGHLLTAAAGRLFFVQYRADGAQLWTSDGTAAGTRKVTSFEAPQALDETGWLKPAGGRVYFLANDIVHGEEIWVSDGTTAGTRRVTDFGFFRPFGEVFGRLRPEELAGAGEGVVFRATDGLSPDTLWGSAGTPESTVRLTEPCLFGCPTLLTVAGGRIFFERDEDLWVSDGTSAGTRSVRAFDRIEALETVGSQIRFLATDRNLGAEYWTSDGTPAGTRPLTDLPGGVFVSSPVVLSGNRLYFPGSESRHGRELLGLRCPRHRPPGRRHPPEPAGVGTGKARTAAGDRLFWTACRSDGRVLLASAGTPETTAVVPGAAESCSFSFFAPSREPTGVGSLLFYLREDAARHPQLWVSDGTSTTVLTSFGPDSFLVPRLVVLGGQLLFVVQSGEESALWESDGTPAGTVERFDLPARAGETLIRVGSKLFFWSVDFGNEGVYRSDGTAAGTRRLSSGLRPAGGLQVQRLGSTVFFVAVDGNAAAGLYRADDGATTASLVFRLHGPQTLTAFAGALYFFEPVDGFWSLWRSDGTPAGTAMLHPFALPVDGENFTLPDFELVPYAGRLWFQADDGEHGLELWATNGTPAGTVLVRDLRPGAKSSQPLELTAAGDRLYFTADDDLHGRELWQSDGTAGGTRLAQDLAPQGISSSPAGLTVVGSRLYFAANDLLTGREVWYLPLATPGCQPTSRRLCLQGGRFQVEATWRDFSGHQGLGTAVPLSGDTGYFWFFAPDNVEAAIKVLDGQGVNGHVWVFYGALSNVEYNLTVTDTQTGLTRRYFNPSGQLASVGDTTGFGPQGASLADQGSLFVAPPSPAVAPLSRFDSTAKAGCVPSLTRLCLGGGRFAVDVAWKDFAGNTGTGKAVPLTADTGTFWFFDSANVELVLKVLDGRPVTGKYWVFYGALSSVEYTITVTDTATGQVKTYRNPSGRLASVADTGAF